MTQTRATAQPTPSFTPAASGVLQRKCACGGKSSGECDECRKNARVLQSRAENPEFKSRDDAFAPSIVHEVVRSPGQSFDPATRTFMEARFGHDFSGVRIHADSRAAESARTLNAQAFTVGSNIVFGAGHYAPGTASGRHLLAHELTHVVQQKGLNHSAPSAPLARRVDDVAEAEAEATASRVAEGGKARSITPISTQMIQRQPQSAPAVENKDVGSQKAAERPLTRPEERQLSIASPGEITGTAKPPVISLYNFAIDQATIKVEHRAALKEIADLMKRATAAKLRAIVIGHADSSGEPEVNNPLSQRRAANVQLAIQQLSGMEVQAFWFGEDRPAATNETVEGRSRNRRVDIHFFPTGPIPPPKKDDTDEDDDHDKHKEESEEDRRKKKKPQPVGDDDDFFCKEHPIICLIGAGIIYCILNLEKCFPPSLPDNKEKPDSKEKKRKACPVPPVGLPEGLTSLAPKPPYQKYPFEMKVIFRQEAADKTPYCDCNCGEYRQEVAGFFDRDWGTGKLTRIKKHPLANGKFLDPEIFQEDGDPLHHPEAYGHRYLNDNARHLDKTSAKALLASNIDNDKFLIGDTKFPDRENGCTYIGTDSPGFVAGDDEEVHFHLKFRGGPVDACNGDVHVGEWKSWEVKADRVPIRPKKPPGSQGGGGGPGTGNVSPTIIPPVPYSGPIGAPTTLGYVSGVSKRAAKGERATMTFSFVSQGEVFLSRVQVQVVDVNATEVVVQTTNDVPLNVAPKAHSPIIILPHARQPLLISRLQDTGFFFNK